MFKGFDAASSAYGLGKAVEATLRFVYAARETFTKAGGRLLSGPSSITLGVSLLEVEARTSAGGIVTTNAFDFDDGAIRQGDFVDCS